MFDDFYWLIILLEFYMLMIMRLKFSPCLISFHYQDLKSTQTMGDTFLYEIFGHAVFQEVFLVHAESHPQ